MTREWLTGDFIGEYIGDLDPAFDPTRRTFRLEIVRGTVTNPRACDAPSSDAAATPIYQSALDACYFVLGHHAELRQCPMREIEVHDWRRIEAGESGARLYGRIRGILYAPMIQEEPYVPVESDPAPESKNVATIHLPSIEPDVRFSPLPASAPPVENHAWDAEQGGCMTLLGMLTFMFTVVLLLPLWVAAGVMLNALIPFLVLLSLLTWMLGGKRARGWAWFILVSTVMVTAVYALNDC